jgi:transcriptional regulator with XRE-family HTH domain
MTNLGIRLRKLRRDRNLTVREFAKEIDKSPGYVSRIEARGEIPSPELICQIAEFYAVEPEELLGLAKVGHLDRVEQDLELRHQEALALFRRSRK